MAGGSCESSRYEATFNICKHKFHRHNTISFTKRVIIGEPPIQYRCCIEPIRTSKKSCKSSPFESQRNKAVTRFASEPERYRQREIPHSSCQMQDEKARDDQRVGRGIPFRDSTEQKFKTRTTRASRSIDILADACTATWTRSERMLLRGYTAIQHVSSFPGCMRDGCESARRYLSCLAHERPLVAVHDHLWGPKVACDVLLMC